LSQQRQGISKSRQKTGVPFNVKLLDIPIQIIEKYKEFSKDGLVFGVYCRHVASVNRKQC